jgi:L-alanine-DL-glutamate epimerase-like enolase superfamily enzyme
MAELKTNRRQWLQAGAGAGAALAAGAFAASERTAAADEAVKNAPKLKITAVKTFLLEHKLKRPFGVSVSVPLDKTRTALLVKIETDAGVVGWGETAPISGARGTIDEQIGPALVGRNPLEHRKLWREIWGANFGNGLAVGAIDMALLDIRGKALGLPVAELFGGRLRDRVPAYASAMNYLERRSRCGSAAIPSRVRRRWRLRFAKRSAPASACSSTATPLTRSPRRCRWGTNFTNLVSKHSKSRCRRGAITPPTKRSTKNCPFRSPAGKRWIRGRRRRVSSTGNSSTSSSPT